MSTAANKALVLAFYQQAFNDGQPEQAAAAHLGATYTQHNPGAPDGAEGFIGYVHWLRDLGMAVADLWRIADGKIVEHWDVVQEVPEKSSNDNTMF
jgi:predicted SnoaL-like aldol condensation-catalyzing enzyme